MTFNDVFKSSFLDNLTSVSPLDMVITLLLAFCIGLFIFFIYKKTYQGVMYSSSFGVTLIALTMITSIVIMAVSSNVVLSLGMVGALSIVRFRTAIKEPLDIAFLFWSIAAGIVLAAGMILLAVIGSAVIGAMLLLLVNRKTTSNPYIVVVRMTEPEVEQAVCDELNRSAKRCIMKGKTVKDGRTEINAEIRLADDDTTFINRIGAMAGVQSAALVSYNGDYLG